ncbi:hypothetical protein L873DRAFT_1796333 [Choiromyces venosus 120613-1]|uniref:Uncharacterized protein n=1 Tax=Choiromyces venosus 120613-1 TaxID=1336337 RepID=A0A3N4IW74_9PEZI|nr:hypothetical protein L873DRAFT_1796333 [Choiromyces venosus 120613-1]
MSAIQVKPRGGTTSMSKRGQILAYTTLPGPWKMMIQEISKETGVLKSTCSNIIRESKRHSLESGNSDLCAMENLAPKSNCQKGLVIAKKDKEYLVEVTLSDIAHCQMPYRDLAVAGNSFSSCT